MCTLDAIKSSHGDPADVPNMFSTLSRLPRLTPQFVAAVRRVFGEIEKSTWPKVTTKPNKWT